MTAAAVLRRTIIMVLLLLLLMFSSSSFPSVTAVCPEECTCKREADVDCSNQGQDRIPDLIPSDTNKLYLKNNTITDIASLANLTELQILHLSNNKITDIKALANLTELQILDLENNKITDIESLANLTNLKILYLENNKITDIESLANLTELQILGLNDNKITDIKSLANLTNLKILHLYNNEITDIEALANQSELYYLILNGNKIENIEIGVFNNLTSLKRLNLADNKIHKLDLEMFKGLTKLEELYLDHNMIINIPPGICDSLTSLRLLQLEKNPLKCDCNILFFVNALNKRYGQLDVLGNFDPSCHFPVEMREKSLKEITENDFNCTSPDVIVVPENKTVSVGEQLQLSCKAVGDPEPFITWSKDDIDLELGQRVQVFQNNTLIISKVERTDGGQYKCVASNPLGRKSFESMVKINGLAENGCNTMFGVIPYFSFIVIILANCLLYNDIL